jgi:hypothetical protein
MMFHKLCLFEFAFDYGDGSVDPPQQLFTGNSPSLVVPEQICGVDNSGLFNAYAQFGTAGLLDASAEAQIHLDEWRSAGAQLLMNINEAVDGKVALEAADAEPGLIEIDSTFMCAQGVWLPWLVDMVDALEGGDSSVAAVDVEDICGIEIHLPALELPGELFEAATYSNRPFLPSYGVGECYLVAPISFAHINNPEYANLHALVAVLNEDGILTKEDMYNVWVDMECRWEEEVNGWWAGCGLD